ncbi:hypothetical protein Tco_0293526, partial [Tanacetum coccineum]
GDGEVGIGEGELGSVLGRWFGSENVGKGGMGFGGKWYTVQLWLQV